MIFSNLTQPQPLYSGGRWPPCRCCFSSLIPLRVVARVEPWNNPLFPSQLPRATRRSLAAHDPSLPPRHRLAYRQPTHSARSPTKLTSERLGNALCSQRSPRPDGHSQAFDITGRKADSIGRGSPRRLTRSPTITAAASRPVPCQLRCSVPVNG